MRIRFVLFALVALFVTLAVCVDESSFTDCESCTAAGFGWNIDGAYCSLDEPNTDCAAAESSKYDYGEDDDDIVDDGNRVYGWADTDATTRIWQIIHGGNVDELASLLSHDPNLVKYRSADGRGALWWAYEYGHGEMVDILVEAGADDTATDRHGKTPSQMAGSHSEL